jgi:hypothetical protein
MLAYHLELDLKAEVFSLVDIDLAIKYKMMLSF